MKQRESAFLKWFTAQFGKRENGELSDAALVELVKDGKNAERILRERANWDANHTAALYAWTARDRVGATKPKKGKAVKRGK